MPTFCSVYHTNWFPNDVFLYLLKNIIHFLIEKIFAEPTSFESKVVLPHTPDEVTPYTSNIFKKYKNRSRGRRITNTRTLEFFIYIDIGMALNSSDDKQSILE